jgi:hypothetical protein
MEEVVLDCPYCGEPVALAVDTTAGHEQSYYEDCAVCCRPMEILVRCRPGEIEEVSIASGE